MKGIILAGGSGTRLYPLTISVSKQLLPVYSKPMIYYPLSVLMMAGIRDILIITTPQDNESFKRLFGDGKEIGIKLTYAVQPKPEGLAQAFLIANEVGFLNNEESVALILGDNIFHCSNFATNLKIAVENCNKGYATIFCTHVNDPQRYGIAEIKNDEVISIEEKPLNPKSDLCVTGLYFYPNNVLEKVKKIKPSERGELEITTLNQMYLNNKKVKATILSRGDCWFDAGTIDSLSEVSNYVETIEKRQGLMIACLEEIAIQNDWISPDNLYDIAAEKFGYKTAYANYLCKILVKKIRKN